MPMYEYQCTSCSHEFEDFAKMSETACPACPQCGQGSKKLISCAALKGGATPFDSMDRVKMLHPAAKKRMGLNTCPSKGGGG